MAETMGTTVTQPVELSQPDESTLLGLGFSKGDYERLVRQAGFLLPIEQSCVFSYDGALST